MAAGTASPSSYTGTTPISAPACGASAAASDDLMISRGFWPYLLIAAQLIFVAYVGRRLRR
jgi:hypothetical protein